MLPFGTQATLHNFGA